MSYFHNKTLIYQKTSLLSRGDFLHIIGDMQRTLISQTPNLIGQEVKLCGWINARRDHGKIIFLDLRDRSGLIQVVLALQDEVLQKLGHEDVIEITGTVKKRPEAMVNEKIPTGKVEIEVKEIKLLSKSEELPFDMGTEELKVSLPTLLDYRSLTLRHPKQKAIFKVQEVIINSFRKALAEKDFTEFQSPSIIPSVPEGGSEVFKISYFDHQAYLSQSPQLYKSLLVSVFERVFSVNKVFRAEPSVTTTHLAEFVSLDAEMGFIDSWIDVREMAEYVVKFILKEVEEKCRTELEMFGATIPKTSEKIPSLKMREAQQIIFERTGRDCRKEKDLAPEDEREICEFAQEKYNSELIFISHYLTKYRPFYTYPDEENSEFNQGFDLLGRGREWLTGGRRINDYKMLMQHVKDWKVDPEKIKLYLDAFKYGMPPLGGFAFGAERITMFILGLKNIREASLFPRDMERIDMSFSVK